MRPPISLALAALAGGVHAQDAGLRVAELALPDRPGAMAPALSPAGEEVQLTWLEPDGAGRRRSWDLRLSAIRADAVTAPETVVRDAALLANWADFPRSLRDPQGGLVLAWLQRARRGAYGIVVGYRAPGGERVARLGHPHRVGIRGEHGFVSMVPEGSGVRLFWLDGRHFAAEQRMELRSAVVAGGEIGSEEVLDQDVCSCCQTAAVRTSKGPVVVYRGHAEGEIRDILFVRRQGEGWSEPEPVAEDGWVIPGCPVNGPAVALAGDELAVAWFTGAGGRASVRLAFAAADGPFRRPFEVDGEKPVGRVDVLAFGPGVLLSWIGAARDGRAPLWVQEFDAGGPRGDRLAVAEVAASRRTGFPRLARLADAALLVWTDAGRPSRLRAVRIERQ